VLPTKLPSTSISQFGTLASIVSPDRAAAGDRQPKRHPQTWPQTSPYRASDGS
jgi:hypothetical protein